ncbi:MAG: hypothetical protein ACKVWV_00590 [Planctomycetota bacterium]
MIDPLVLSDPVIEVYKRGVDVTLIRENLKLTPQQRVEKMIAVAKFAEELRRAGRAASCAIEHE